MPKKTKKAKSQAALRREKIPVTTHAERQTLPSDGTVPSQHTYTLSLNKPLKESSSKSSTLSLAEEEFFNASKKDIVMTVILAALAIIILFGLSILLA